MVCCGSGGVFEMLGGEISGNTAVSVSAERVGAGGVHVGGQRPGGASFLMSGGVVCRDNVSRHAGDIAYGSSPLSAEGSASALRGLSEGGAFFPLGELEGGGCHAIEVERGELAGLLPVSVTGIPARYDGWERSIYLWDGRCGWFGASAEIAVGPSAAFSVRARPGIYAVHFYVWRGDEWREFSARRRRLSGAGSTISFRELSAPIGSP